MTHFSRLAIFSSFILSLMSCNSFYTQDLTETVPTNEICAQVKQLVAEHDKGFEQLKGHMVVSSKLDVWQANYHLIGKDCQVWRWSNGKQAYMCSRVLPDQETAIKKHDKAIAFTRQCLGQGWSSENITREQTGAVRTIFSRQGEKTVLSVHRINTRGLFDSEWTVYYFVGDRESTL